MLNTTHCATARAKRPKVQRNTKTKINKLRRSAFRQQQRQAAVMEKLTVHRGR